MLLLKLQAFVDQLGNAAKYHKHLFDLRLLVDAGVLNGTGRHRHPPDFQEFCQHIPMVEFNRLLAAVEINRETTKLLDSMAKWELEMTQQRQVDTSDVKELTYDGHKKDEILPISSVRWERTLNVIGTTLAVSSLR